MSTSRARGLVTADRRPKCQPRTVSAASFRVAEPEPAQRLERFRVVGRAGEDKAADLGGEVGALLEQQRVMRLDLVRVTAQSFLEGFEVGKAAELGEARQRLGVGRKPLRLLVRDHLQAVLDRAKEAVGVGQLVARLRRDPTLVVERDEHVEGALPAQGGAPAAEDELLRLHEELDLADAAASELDVVTGDGDLVVPAHRVDLPLHGVNVGDRGEVEILAPDERREILEEALAEGEVAGDGPRLDQRGPLPVLANRLVVGVGGAERHRDRRRAGVGTQAVIDAMDVAVRRPLPQQLGEIARQAAVEGRGLVPVRQRRRRWNRRTRRDRYRWNN